MNKPTETTTYSIGMEELALALALVNAPARSRELLAVHYPDDRPELIEARLTTASHALLASGLCRLGESGALLLDPEFEQAAFALVKYDSFINLRMVTGNVETPCMVAIRKGTFTSRLVHSDAVQVLTHGALAGLPGHLAALLAEIGEGGTDRELKPGLTPAVLTETTGKDATAIAALLKSKGWPEEDASLLAADLAAPQATVTLVHVHADDETAPEELLSARANSLLMLRGEKNSWAVQIPEADSTANGSVRLVDRIALEEILTAFVA